MMLSPLLDSPWVDWWQIFAYLLVRRGTGQRSPLPLRQTEDKLIILGSLECSWHFCRSPTYSNSHHLFWEASSMYFLICLNPLIWWCLWWQGLPPPTLECCIEGESDLRLKLYTGFGTFSHVLLAYYPMHLSSVSFLVITNQPWIHLCVLRRQVTLNFWASNQAGYLSVKSIYYI